jgi:carboxypeptidase C (cathepsin A)
MLYLDQPFRTGYSNGTLGVGTAKSAETYVWRFLQTFYHAFPYYDNRNFGFFSESYGGHWVPAFVEYL